MRTFSTVAALILAIGALAQNETDAQGRKQGPWVKTYEGTSDVRYTGQFKDDKPVGTFKYYHEGGQLSAEMRFAQGGVSRCVNFHDNGQKMAEGKYVQEQQKDSIWNYYDRNGALRKVEQYQGGKLHGLTVAYYANGQEAQRIHWQRGVEEGEWQEFFEDGNPKIQGRYSNGEPEGENLYYYSNGKVEIRGQWRNGNRDGNWKYYNEDGSVQLQVLYADGQFVKEKKENGVFKEYFRNEKLKSEHTYSNGMRHGPFKEYYDSGEWVIEDRPEGPKGEPADKVRVLKGQQVMRSGNYKNDELHGEVKYFFDNGRLEKVEMYSEGTLQK